MKEIDGLPVISFLLRQSLAFNLQDPDAKYNADFFQLGRQSFLSQTKNVRFYPGPSTKVTFVNGTIKTYDNVALVNEPLDGIQSGDELYTSLLIPATTSSAATSTVSTSTTSSTAPTNQPVFASGYPYPAIKDSQNLFLGYFLNDTDYNDVAVLQVASYEPTVLPDNWQQEVQNVLQNFFAAAVKLGKRKLILDFQGNPGKFWRMVVMVLLVLTSPRWNNRRRFGIVCSTIPIYCTKYKIELERNARNRNYGSKYRSSDS